MFVERPRFDPRALCRRREIETEDVEIERASGVDIVDRKQQAVGGTRRGIGDALAEDDRGLRAGRRQLNDPEVVTGREIGIETPAQALVEAFRPVGVSR